MRKIKILGAALVLTFTLMMTACGKTDTTVSSEVTGEAGVTSEDNTKEKSSEDKAAAEKEALKDATEKTSDEVSEEALPEYKIDLADGEYSAGFDTDSSMFHINEAYDGKGTLTVRDGKASIHIVMPSTKIQKLFLGLAEDAQKEGAKLIDHTVETVTYDDGFTEEANAFDVPVYVIDEEFDLALIGEKEKWYDHKVKVSDPKPITEVKGGSETSSDSETAAAEKVISLTLEGGSGKAGIKSPAEYTMKDDTYVIRLEWSSPHYDYMIVDDVKYTPVNTDGNSVFEIPFKDISNPVTVIADTTAMSTPHEIEYTITFDEASIK